MSEGKEEEIFRAHTYILSAHSKEFKKMLQGTDCERKPILISDASFETLDIFIMWCYAVNFGASIYDSVEVDEDDVADDADGASDNIRSGVEKSERHQGTSQINEDRSTTDGGNNNNDDPLLSDHVGLTTASSTRESDQESCQSNAMPRIAGLDVTGRVFHRLVDLYIFSVRYSALDFMRAVILTIQRLIQEWDAIHHPTVVKYALDNLNLDDALSRFLARYYMWDDDIREAHASTLPSDFLTKVLAVISASERWHDDVPLPGEKWCDFHEHKDEDERNECERNQ